jgi:hypothetical protein
MTDPFQGVIYTIANGNLVWYKYLGANQWDPESGSVIYPNFSSAGEICFCGSSGVIYLINASGQLLWFKDLANDGSGSNWAPNSGNCISEVDWNKFSSVTAGGDGIIYAVDAMGDLYWYKDCADDGTATWWAKNSGMIIAPMFMKTPFPSQMVPGGNGIIYVHSELGTLSWWKDGLNNGTMFPWDPYSGTLVIGGIVGGQLWAGTHGTFFSIRGSGMTRYQLAINLDGTLSCTPAGITIPAGLGAAPCMSPLDPVNVGSHIVTLSQEANGSGISYPTFSDVQATCYSDINAQLGETYGDASFDVRAAYANPDAFDPSALYTNLMSSSLQPQQGEDKTDWTDVITQLRFESLNLTTVYNYQNTANSSASDLAIAYGGAFTTANNIVNGGPDITLEILGLLSSLTLPIGDEGALISQAAAFAVALVGLADGTSIAGSFDQLNFDTMVNSVLDTASGLYAQIQPDLGKAQRANRILQAQITGKPQSYQAAADAYEVSLYVAAANAQMAVVAAGQFQEWGSCGPSGTGLAYLPNALGFNGCNGALCDRLAALNIDPANIINRLGGWRQLTRWECMSTEGNWNCVQVADERG